MEDVKDNPPAAPEPTPEPTLEEGPLEKPPEDKPSVEISPSEKIDDDAPVTMKTMRTLIPQIYKEIGENIRATNHVGQCVERLAQLKAEEMSALWEGNRDRSIILPEHIVKAKQEELARKTLQFIFNGDMAAMNDVLKQIDEAMEKKEQKVSASKIVIAGT